MALVEKTCLLTSARVEEITERIVFQVIEAYTGTKSLTMLGVDMRGLQFAERLAKKLQLLGDLNLHFGQLHMLRTEDGQPTGAHFTEKVPCKGRKVLLVDDVLNTGRTLALCFAEVLKRVPKRVDTAVLIARNHKLFPIEAKFVGKNLYTTLEEYVEVHFDEPAGVYLR